MRIDKAIKFHGNVNRVLEMHEGGVGPNGISGTFRDHGIELSAAQAKAIIDSVPVLTSKALPKSASKAQIDATKVAFDPAFKPT